ncbi:MAG: hypothetical protein ACRD3S_16045, partial [Terracidiphilus sp.]
MRGLGGKLLWAAAVLLALSGPTLGRERAYRTDDPDIVQGDWIRPADVLLIGDSESLGYFGAQLYRSLSTEADPR